MSYSPLKYPINSSFLSLYNLTKENNKFYKHRKDHFNMKKSVKKEVKSEQNKKCYWCASFYDIVLTKFAVFFGTLFLVSLIPQIFSDLEDWKWAFLVMALLLSIKPFRSFFKK